MKKIILVILVFMGLGLSAQNNTQQPISCFADIQFVNNKILVNMGHSNTYQSMQPKYLYKNVVISQTNYRSTHLNQGDIKADIERIRTAIESTKVSDLNKEEQEDLLQQIALSLIWNEKFDMGKHMIQSRLDELELHVKSKEELGLVVGLYQQVFE